MSRNLTCVVGNYPQTKPLKSGQIASDRLQLSFVEDFDPVHTAFDAMVQRQPWEACEMAIGALFQARTAGKPISLLPLVMVGSFHHGSIWYAPANGPLAPADLRGKRVGVRSYSQTTGLWVRGILSDEYGIRPEDVTWVTTEGSHSDAYEDPAYVERTAGDADLAGMVRDGELAAAILGPAGAPGLEPLFADPVAAARAWYEQHQLVPINHMVVVKSELADEHPDIVRQVYELFCRGYEAAGIPPAGRREGALPDGVRYGKANVRDALALGMRLAAEQRLIPRAIPVDELFAPGLGES
jgi:4,5-dihydroxyphthalate decarboxylase